MTGDSDNIIDIQRQLHKALLAEIREHRRETRENTELLSSFHRSLSSKIAVLNTRLEALEHDMIDTIKLELGGSLAPLETRLVHHAEDKIAELLEDLTARIEALEKAR